jgi:hypothetical protein
MSIDNKSRQAAFRQRMRLAGKKVITLWVSAEEEQAIRAILSKNADDQADTNLPSVTMDEKLHDPPAPLRRKSIRNSEEN